MPNPKQRHNKSRRNRRRSGQIKNKITPKKLQKCPKCGAFVLPHRVCPECGYYKGREMVNVLKVKKNKK